jgi:hypothetical protein
MPVLLAKKIKHAWNVFRSGELPETEFPQQYGSGTSYRPDRVIIRPTNEKSIVMAVLNRIAMDVAAVSIQHVRLDQNGRFEEVIQSGLNYALTTEANIDQTGTALIQDIVLSLFDEGCVAVIPTDTTINPKLSGAFDIQTLRTGKILEWFPDQIRVRLYNERRGIKQDLTLPKKMVAIIENPLYAVMNEPNSTLKRLIRKLNILDAIDEQSGSGKLDLIIQLPYVIKSEARREQANKRRSDIEEQLSGSKYGIAYTDGTERVTQLNRPAENNLMTQIEYLTKMLYSQLGVTEDVFNGTADEVAMLNYNSRTVYPILKAIVEEFRRKFLTKTARSQNQSIMFFKDVFGIVPVSQLADVADKFTRNEILSSNELRSIIGFKPSKDPKADELRNKNLNPAETAQKEGLSNSDETKGELDNAKTEE